MHELPFHIVQVTRAHSLRNEEIPHEHPAGPPQLPNPTIEIEAKRRSPTVDAHQPQAAPIPDVPGHPAGLPNHHRELPRRRQRSGSEALFFPELIFLWVGVEGSPQRAGGDDSGLSWNGCSGFTELARKAEAAWVGRRVESGLHEKNRMVCVHREGRGDCRRRKCSNWEVCDGVRRLLRPLRFATNAQRERGRERGESLERASLLFYVCFPSQVAGFSIIMLPEYNSD